MVNAQKSDNTKDISNCMTLSTNEVTSVLGENYKTVAKCLNALATEGKIQVTEKSVNNRMIKAYILTVSDLQSIKERFQKSKDLHTKEKSVALQMVANSIDTNENAETDKSLKEDISVKFYEVSAKNLELIQELEKMKSDIQSKINENVRLDADLTVAKSELKFIEDKKNMYENECIERKQEIEKLQKVVKNRNLALMIQGSILLVIVAVACTILFIK